MKNTTTKTSDNSKLVNFRLTKETSNQLEELASIYNITKTKVIENLIFAEYMKTSKKGQAKIQEMIDQLNKLQNMIDELNKIK